MADAEKTEEATPKRIQDARKKGNVLRSQDVTTACILLVALVLFRFLWQPGAAHLRALVERRLGHFPAGDLSAQGLARVFLEDSQTVVDILGPFLLFMLVTGVAVNYAMVGPLFTGETLKPDLKRVDPVAGMKRFFSARSLVELVKGIVKLTLMGVIVWQLLADRYPLILSGLRMSPEISGPIIAETAWDLALRCILLLIAISVADFYWQRFDYKRSLRMSKQEVKDEQRQQEGDPHVKAEVRKRMRQAARRRMMQQVPRATVVITNPTHYAVALKYDDEDAAPMVVAKGTDAVALRIRAIAEEHQVPVHEDPPLARELHRLVDLGDIIPHELFAAVAEILVAVGRAHPEKRILRQAV